MLRRSRSWNAKRLLFELGSALYPRNLGVGIPRRGYLSVERYHMLEKAFLYTRDESVEGEYVEFGVANGRSLIYAYELCEKYGLLERTRFIGFDSFQGFPEPAGVDKVVERFHKGELAYAKSVVERNLRFYGADLRRIELVEGWYNDTLRPETKRRLDLRRAKVVNIDCDLHASTLSALRFVTDSLTDGMVILFDDWLCYRADPTRGEQAAARKWLAENPALSLVPYSQYATAGQSFIVNVRRG